VDWTLIDLERSLSKSRLGAHAIVGVLMALARADRGGRDRVLPDRKRDGHPLRLPGQQNPLPLANCEPRLTAATTERPARTPTTLQTTKNQAQDLQNLDEPLHMSVQAGVRGAA